MKEHNIWVEKYRPKFIENYIGNELLKYNIKKWISNPKELPHLLLYSSPGTGKTSLAKLLVNNIECNYQYINASDERGIDIVRDKIQNFAQAASFNPFKIIILDEADYLTSQAQASLRNIIETFSLNTRFILTCNYLERITEPIQSRCLITKITPPSKEEVREYIIYILEKENIKFELKNLDLIIKNNYPDIRKIINTCQNSTKENILILNNLIDSNYLNKILIELQKPSSNSWKNIRQILLDSNISDFEECYNFLYNKVDEYAKNKEAQIIIKIEEYLYHSNFRIDKEINIMACILSILEIIQQKNII